MGEDVKQPVRTLYLLIIAEKRWPVKKKKWVYSVISFVLFLFFDYSLLLFINLIL